MESYSIPISFNFAPGDGSYENTERFAFWASPNTMQWFKTRGYILYQRSLDESGDSSFPSIPSKVEFAEAEYPYACYDTETVELPETPVPLRAWDMTGKVGYAQDSLGRHVAIKIVPKETDEYRILQFLNQQKLETLKENCVVPVLELLPNEDFWFAVMPRWAAYIDNPEPQYLHEIVTMIHSLLKGMNYLHEHNIVHGDINEGNFLVNHISDMHWRCTKRSRLRAKKSLLYALFDFDLSIMAPPNIDKKDFRLPAYKSWGSFNVSNDTAAGEHDYNPFILDVGSMGVYLCQNYQHMTDLLPILAPLLDMMTCWDLRRRFTASEALQFLEDRMAEISEADLASKIVLTKPRDPYKKYNECDRWENLSPEFVERWQAYRETPLPWHIPLLRRVCKTQLGTLIVLRTRAFVFKFTSLPRRLHRWLVPAKIAL
ncbi:hypothetical protein CVT25_007152 [Psilocybe cyanescens]|uniref:Protein kinase domain-containing protein n=1 Tax=Psilocybe cyanescens TaxID=93625 RepID=A0A409WVJ9_PSICY|nr:hypothetical protein CVT25_007152 [Psilocybe cyanescens]